MRGGYSAFAVIFVRAVTDFALVNVSSKCDFFHRREIFRGFFCKC